MGLQADFLYPVCLIGFVRDVRQEPSNAARAKRGARRDVAKIHRQHTAQAHSKRPPPSNWQPTAIVPLWNPRL